MYRALSVCSLLAACVGCTWVELEPAAGQVTIAAPEDITRCEKLSHVTAKVMDGVGFIDRSTDKVAEELSTIARNEAARLGGDTIVPASPIEDGRQHFSVFLCNS